MSEAGSMEQARVAGTATALECAMRSPDLGSHVPQLRPHYRRRGLEVFFMISKRASLNLSADEVRLYDSIDGHRSVAELEGMHPLASEKLSTWHKVGLLELISPAKALSKPHLVVIEPHMDDAVLSAGGRLLHRRYRSRITLLTVVKWSNFTSYLLLKRDFMNVGEISELRQKESALVATVLGAEHQSLGWTDAPLRFCPPERWSSRTIQDFTKAPQDFVKGFPKPEEISLLARQLMTELDKLQPDEIWIPMGLGDHLDHRTTRSACLKMLHEAPERFGNVPVSMYEDLPYASEPGHSELIRSTLSSVGTDLVRMTEDITDVFEEKVRVSSIYASQFKTSYLEPMLGGFAGQENGKPGRLVEVYHKVEGELSLPSESDLSRDRADLVTLGRTLRSLLRKRTTCRRLRVLALPTGHLRDWKTDSESLVSAFPNADVCVYVPADMAWQTEDGENTKLKVELVHGKWNGWFGVLSREIFRFGTPTIVMWRGAYSSTPPMRPLKKIINLIIRSLLPLRKVFLARRLSDFCCVLHEQTQQEPSYEP